jgi:hypothetical protein
MTDYAVRVSLPGQDPYIDDDGLPEEIAKTIAESINTAYGLGQVAVVVPQGGAK